MTLAALCLAGATAEPEPEPVAEAEAEPSFGYYGFQSYPTFPVSYGGSSYYRLHKRSADPEPEPEPGFRRFSSGPHFRRVSHGGSFHGGFPGHRGFTRGLGHGRFYG